MVPNKKFFQRMNWQLEGFVRKIFCLSLTCLLHLFFCFHYTNTFFVKNYKPKLFSNIHSEGFGTEFGTTKLVSSLLLAIIIWSKIYSTGFPRHANLSQASWDVKLLSSSSWTFILNRSLSSTLTSAHGVWLMLSRIEIKTWKSRKKNWLETI